MITLSFLLAVAVHELGHIAASLLLDIRFKLKEYGLFGINLEFRMLEKGLAANLILLISGSAVGLLTSAIIIKSPIGYNDFFLYYCISSSCLAIFNLLPIRGLDGGYILYAILDRMILPDRSEIISRVISAVFTLLLWTAAVRVQLRYGGNPSLIMISVFLLLKSFL